MNEIKTCAVCKREFKTEQDYLTGTTRWRVCSEGNLWFNCGCGSTHMLKKGKFRWYSPEQCLGEEARSILNKLGNLKDLPHIPNEALVIQRLLQDPEVEPKDVAHELRREPVLATQVLQIAENIRNSRSPATPKIMSLEHAIVYIGFKALSDLIITSSLKTLPLPNTIFDAEAFWSESYLTGAIAENLMRRFAPHLGEDEAFLAGALCNIGKLVTALCFPPLIGKLVQDVSGTREPLLTWRQAELSYHFPDHSILGEIASTLWGFPVHILEATRKHHHVPGKTGRLLDLNDIVAVANQMSHWVLLRPHRMEYDIVKAFALHQQLSEKDLDQLARELTKLKIQTDPGPAHSH